jgi:hypothetical protein
LPLELGAERRKLLDASLAFSGFLGCGLYEGERGFLGPDLRIKTLDERLTDLGRKFPVAFGEQINLCLDLSRPLQQLLGNRLLSPQRTRRRREENGREHYDRGGTYLHSTHISSCRMRLIGKVPEKCVGA